MIHAYNDYFVYMAQEKLGNMFELAVTKEGMNIDDFTSKFLSSYISHAFETADPIYIEGKSANELLALVLNTAPKNYVQSNYATAEYWVGYVLAYAQWYFNMTFNQITKCISSSKLLENYFPYHEMDIMKTIGLIKSYIPFRSALKEQRIKKGYSQSELALMSCVPIRNIRAYEQGELDISKASVGTVYALSVILGCSMEDLIK